MYVLPFNYLSLALFCLLPNVWLDTYIVLKTIIFARLVYQDFQILASYQNFALNPISFTERDNLLPSKPSGKSFVQNFFLFSKKILHILHIWLDYK